MCQQGVEWKIILLEKSLSSKIWWQSKVKVIVFAFSFETPTKLDEDWLFHFFVNLSASFQPKDKTEDKRRY